MDVRSKPDSALISMKPHPQSLWTWSALLCMNVTIPYKVAKSHRTPSDSKAARSSPTAVLTSSKFKADIAHRACFWAAAMASSSTLLKSAGSGWIASELEDCTAVCLTGAGV